jgi:DNA-binding MarR family transcriptional regulator
MLFGVSALAHPDRVPAGADAHLEGFARAWEAFFRAARSARARLGVQATLTVSQYFLIERLRDGEPRSVRELAQHAGVAAPTATRMLDGLVRDGMVQRRHSERDRRCLEVLLTAAGRAAVDERHRLMHTARRQVFEALEPDDRVAAERLLRRLAEATEAIDL